MKSAEIRKAFLNFFKEQGHEIVVSSPLVPANDPTLLFTNAGMVQFKDVFLGQESLGYLRAASAQRCLRAGGKHNDLDNVGYTARHHTFFEMLGNFSFGDYFKREAIHYAWTFLTQRLNIPTDKLWVTVYQDDDEAAAIWLNEIKIDAGRLSRIGDKPSGQRYDSDNFWSMGDTGPCGPCSEIFYDHGPSVAGGAPGTPDEDGDRYIEIWNLVFMQYDRKADGSMAALPKPSVDTGMGLERLAAILQGVHSNYEIDIFQSLIQATAKLTGCQDLTQSSLRVIADHIRSTSFMIVDGVLPSNEGRGYVLRRIIRRAVRHGYMLGVKDVFFYKLVATLVQEMGEAYPELASQQANVEKFLKLEEERFAETLEQGMKILEQDIAGLQSKVIPGDVVFKLYDTYGFPADLTADIARERGLTLDMEGFKHAMALQKQRGRAASRFAVDYSSSLDIKTSSEFTGYTCESMQTEITAIVIDGALSNSVSAGENASIVLAKTPFYAESGGQVGDRGEIFCKTGKFQVDDTQKQGADTIVHHGKLLAGTLNVGDWVSVEIDSNRRRAIERNHSATHLLHAALRRVLGEHVVQKGSLVDGDKLRFDFSHIESLTADELTAVEKMVNEQICVNSEVKTQLMSYDEATQSGAMALFGEKYADQVRVLSVGDFSVELCGGTHVKRAGDIGLFKIVNETGIASGIRRIEAITGSTALSWVEADEAQLKRIAQLVKGKRDDVETKVARVIRRVKELERELEQLKGQLASRRGGDLVSEAVDVNGVKVLAVCLDDVDPKALRELLDQLKNKLGSAIIVLATAGDAKVSLVAGVTSDCTSRVKAGELVNYVATQVGGKGGGRPDMAQAGGNNPQALAGALSSVYEWVEARL